MSTTTTHLVAGLLAGVLFSGGLVNADTTVYNASSVCAWNPAHNLQPSVQGWVENHETSGAEHRVSCGLVLTNDVASSSTDDVYVYFHDENADNDMEDDVYCNVYTCDVTGDNCANEQTKFGNGSGGSTSQTEYDGDGYISLTNLDKPAFGIPNVTCAIPANDDMDGDRSAIYGIYMVH